LGAAARDSRIRGHKKGAQAVRTVVRTCREIGVKYLTLFAFSVENWERPDKEVQALMVLLEEYLTREIDEIAAAGNPIDHHRRNGSFKRVR